MDKTPWYIGGLAFECTGCGQCCSGPGEGVIWITRPEIERLSDVLDMPVLEVQQQYLRRVGPRTTIIEEPRTRDCIFLETTETGKQCRIYPVRPNQCRTWPFWPSNLGSPNQWNQAARTCPGMNRGPLYSAQDIDRIRKQRQWW